MAKALTPLKIKNLKPVTKRKEIPDSTRGLWLVQQPSGHLSFAVRFRVSGKPKKLTLDRGISLPDARVEAAKIYALIEKGNDPSALKKRAKQERREAQANTFEAIANEYYELKKVKAQRTSVRAKNDLNRLVFAEIGHRPISEIKRSEVMRLMNKIESRNGPRMADMIYSHIAQVMQWWETQSDDFSIPLPRKGRSTEAEPRKRILTDNELRNIWTTAQQNGDPFAKLVQFLLLTGARLQEAAQMTRAEVQGDIWLLPARRNFKTKQDVRRPLSKAAEGILDGLPAIGDGGFFFTQSGTPLGNIGERKSRLAKASGTDAPPPEGKIDERFAGDWRLHDLRRTAKSLLSRAGTNPLVSEKCLGHMLPGIQKTYDQHDYVPEMRAAYEALATLIGLIVYPPTDNVVPIRK